MTIGTDLSTRERRIQKLICLLPWSWGVTGSGNWSNGGRMSIVGDPLRSVALRVRFTVEQLVSDAVTLATTVNCRADVSDDRVSTTDAGPERQLIGTTTGSTFNDSRFLTMLLALADTLHVTSVTRDVTS